MNAIVLRNDVPLLERFVALLFVAVGGPLIYLAWRDASELPELLVPVIRIGVPMVVLAIVWRAFVSRRRVRVTLEPGGHDALVEYRLLFTTRRTSVTVVAVDLEVGDDIDGDPYGSLVLRLGDGSDLVAAEGNDIEDLEARLEAVRSWLDG